MNKKIIYGIKIGGGTYDDHWSHISLVFTYKEDAIKYIEKYNKVLDKLKVFKEELDIKIRPHLQNNKLELPTEISDLVDIVQKYSSIEDMYHAEIQEIEIR